MRISVLLTSVVFAVVAWPASAQDRPQRSVEIETMNVFVCPQHPEVRATWRGRCPLCGSELRERERPPARPEKPMGMPDMKSPTGPRERLGESAEHSKKSVFSCPRHPQMQATWPAPCPICGSRLRERPRRPAAPPQPMGMRDRMAPGASQERPGSSAERAGLHVFACPRHPLLEATWPALCPICGSRLQKKGQPPSAGRKSVSMEDRMKAGLARMSPAMRMRHEMMMNAAIHVYDPEALLGARAMLGLTDQQVRSLRVIAMTARRGAEALLTSAQRRKLAPLATMKGFPSSMAEMRRKMMRDMSDPPEAGTTHPYADPIGRENADFDEDEGFGEGAGLGGDFGGDEGFGNDEGFGYGFGDEGFGGEEGFGRGFGEDEGLEGEEGFGGEEGLGQRFGRDEGFGRGFGEDEGRRGDEGLGREFGENEGFGPGDRATEGFRGDTGFRGDEAFRDGEGSREGAGRAGGSRGDVGDRENH
jgi:hypothetical protein